MTTLNATVTVNRKTPAWVFWLLWSAATFLGALAYFIPVGLVQILLGLDRLGDPQRAAEIGTAMRVVAAVLCGGACGSTIGLGQWLVLRRELQHTGWWVAATIAGYASVGLFILIGNAVQPGWLDWAVTLIVNGKMHWLARVGPTDPPEWLAASQPAGTVALTLCGAVLGVMQWLVLRGRVERAGWWIAISTIGWACAAALSSLPNAFLAVSASFDLPVLVSGLGMVWLLRKPKVPN